MNSVNIFFEFEQYYKLNNFEASRRFLKTGDYSNTHLKKVLEDLDNPQLSYKTIHIAGTVAKGSMAIYLSRLFSLESLTGLYTSPHYQLLSERIQVGGENIRNEDFHLLWNIIKNQPGHSFLSFFDVLTAISFLYFKEKNIEWGVIECGLGGRLDSTNNVSPEIVVITPIDFDHEKILGSTLKEIAREKSGIIKEDSLVYDMNSNLFIQDLIRNVCTSNGAQYHNVPSFQEGNYLERNLKSAQYIYQHYYHKSPAWIKKECTGRLEKVSSEKNIYFDSAHNNIGMEYLGSWASSVSNNWHIYINCMKERNIQKFIDILKSFIHIDTIFLFNIEEAGFYQQNDFLNDHFVQICNDRQRLRDLFNREGSHLVCGSIRLYAPLIELLSE